MKAVTRLMIASLLAIHLIAVATQAQTKGSYTKNKESAARTSATAQSKLDSAAAKVEERTRSLYLKKTADAVQVVILKVNETQMVPVDPSQVFKEKDEIKVSFRSNFAGYVYVINVAPSGKKCVFFPNSEEPNNAVAPGKEYYLPAKHTLVFDDEKGVEVLQVIMSHKRIAYLDSLLKDSDGCIGESASSAAAALEQGGVVVKDVTPALPKNGVRTRDIIVAAGRDKDPQGSVVAVADETGKGGKLKAGEAVIFEIRLKHN